MATSRCPAGYSEGGAEACPSGVPLSRWQAAMKTSRGVLLSLATVFSPARRLFSCAVAVCLLFGPGGAVPAPARPGDKKPKQDPALKGLPIRELSADEAILHALNRLAYGPRPGDIERVK